MFHRQFVQLRPRLPCQKLRHRGVGGGFKHGGHALHLHAHHLAQGGGKVRLQRGQGHAAVFAGVHAVAGVGAAHGAAGLGQAPAAGQGQPGGGVAQGHFLKHALATGFLGQHGFEHGFGGHQGAAHVGKQGGGQVQPRHQAGVGQVGQVVAGLFGACARRTNDGHHAERGVGFVQRFPAQAQFGQRRGAERGQQHVGAGQFALQLGLAFGRFQIDRDGAHAFVHGGVGAGVVLAHGVAAAEARWRGRLGFGAGGAHGAQAHQRGRAGQVERQAEHAHTAQGFQGLLCCGGGGGGHGVWGGVDLGVNGARNGGPLSQHARQGAGALPAAKIEGQAHVVFCDGFQAGFGMHQVVQLGFLQLAHDGVVVEAVHDAGEPPAESLGAPYALEAFF